MNGNTKKKQQRKQAHQNTFTFRHNPNSVLTKEIMAINISGLCRRCNDKIEWRRNYRKYKIQTHLSKCTLCQTKSIKLAYNIVCDPCSNQKNICRICRVTLCFETCAPLEEVLRAKEEGKPKEEKGAAKVENSDEIDSTNDEVKNSANEIDSTNDKIENSSN